MFKRGGRWSRTLQNFFMVITSDKSSAPQARNFLPNFFGKWHWTPLKFIFYPVLTHFEIKIQGFSKHFFVILFQKFTFDSLGSQRGGRSPQRPPPKYASEQVRLVMKEIEVIELKNELSSYEYTTFISMYEL